MKFYIKDEDENMYEVEEVKSQNDGCGTTVANDDEAQLSSDEITALKSLAAVADKLMKLLDVEAEEHAATSETEAEDDDGNEEQVYDTDEDIDEETKTVIKKASDSKKSFGAIEKRKFADTSYDKHEEDIANAWQKRYGGNK